MPISYEQSRRRKRLGNKSQRAARPAPSFVKLKSSSKAASAAKKRNFATNTAHELRLQRALTALGVRYRAHASQLPGKPDIVIASSRIAVFCDGDFWHGRSWNTLRAKLSAGSNANYWLRKIAYNRARDKRVKRELASLGWETIRVWETDIHRNASIIADAILERVAVRRQVTG